MSTLSRSISLIAAAVSTASAAEPIPERPDQPPPGCNNPTEVRIVSSTTAAWTGPVSTGASSLSSGLFLDQDHGLVVGADGFVASTSDGGLVWNQEVTDRTQDLAAVALNGKSVVAVGEEGLILKRRGQKWKPQKSASRTDLNDVAFHEGVGIAVGDGGTILKSKGGKWRKVSVPTEVDLHAVMHTNTGQWVAVGDDAWIGLSVFGDAWMPAIPYEHASVKAGNFTDVFPGQHGFVAVGQGVSAEPMRPERDHFVLRGDPSALGIADGFINHGASVVEGQWVRWLDKPSRPLNGGVVTHVRLDALGHLLVTGANGEVVVGRPWTTKHTESISRPCGRPFRVGGDVRLASATERSGWATPFEPRAGDSTTREAIGRAWLADARAEHASVAAFSRFALQLLAVGAPASMLHDCHRAVGDEIRHAEDCFGLATAFLGVEFGPGPLPMKGAVDDFSLAAVAADVAREGCIGETLAALLATEAAHHTFDLEIRGVLTRIAEDETRHAQLAWRFLRWAFDQGDEAVRVAVQAAFEAAEVPQMPPVPPDVDPIAWGAGGRLPAAVQRRALRRGLGEIVRPAADALLSSLPLNQPPRPSFNNTVSTGTR